MIKVSVIVPVYNAEKFVSRCLLSIVEQTLADIEIIVINDGSTDASAGEIKKMAALDNRIIFLSFPNRGVSAARNEGLKKASGDYIGFVDADDTIENTMLEKMFIAAVTNNADMVVCNASNCDVTNVKLGNRMIIKDEVRNVVAQREQILNDVFRFNYDYANWNKLYNGNLMRHNDIGFNESQFIWEDLLFNLQYLQYSSRLVVLEEPLYNYTMHAASAMSGSDQKLPQQFDLLYQNFLSWCNERSWPLAAAAFRQAFAKNCYYSFIPKMLSIARRCTSSKEAYQKSFATAMKQLNNSIMSDVSALPEVDPIKRILLKKKYFEILAWLAAQRNTKKSTNASR